MVNEDVKFYVNVNNFNGAFHSDNNKNYLTIGQIKIAEYYLDNDNKWCVKSSIPFVKRKNIHYEYEDYAKRRCIKIGETFLDLIKGRELTKAEISGSIEEQAVDLINRCYSIETYNTGNVEMISMLLCTSDKEMSNELYKIVLSPIKTERLLESVLKKYSNYRGIQKLDDSIWCISYIISKEIYFSGI